MRIEIKISKICKLQRDRRRGTCITLPLTAPPPSHLLTYPGKSKSQIPGWPLIRMSPSSPPLPYRRQVPETPLSSKSMTKFNPNKFYLEHLFTLNFNTHQCGNDQNRLEITNDIFRSAQATEYRVLGSHRFWITVRIIAPLSLWNNKALACAISGLCMITGF